MYLIKKNWTSCPKLFLKTPLNKSTELTSSVFKSQHMLFSYTLFEIFYNLYPKLLQETAYFKKKLGSLVQESFVLLPVKSTELTSSGIESQLKFCFFLKYFFPESIPKCNLIKHQNQLDPMSILSNTGKANSRHSWLVHHRVTYWN